MNCSLGWRDIGRCFDFVVGDAKSSVLFGSTELDLGTSKCLGVDRGVLACLELDHGTTSWRVA